MADHQLTAVALNASARHSRAACKKGARQSEHGQTHQVRRAL
jgi:hypothetical protein